MKFCWTEVTFSNHSVRYSYPSRISILRFSPENHNIADGLSVDAVFLGPFGKEETPEWWGWAITPVYRSASRSLPGEVLSCLPTSPQWYPPLLVALGVLDRDAQLPVEVYFKDGNLETRTMSASRLKGCFVTGQEGRAESFRVKFTKRTPDGVYVYTQV